MADNVALRMRLVPERQYPTLKSWDMFPTVNGTSSLANQIGQRVTMPATCNRQRIYIAAMILADTSSFSLSNPVGNLDVKLKGFDALGQLMAEIPVGIHVVQAHASSIAAKLLALPTGYSESRPFNRANVSTAPQTYTAINLQYGWTMRGGEMPNLDSPGTGSGGNAGISDARDCFVLAGEASPALAGTTNGFAVTVAPWGVEAPVTEWELSGVWRNTTVGQTLGLSITASFFAIVFGLFIGEQV